MAPPGRSSQTTFVRRGHVAWKSVRNFGGIELESFCCWVDGLWLLLMEVTEEVASGERGKGMGIRKGASGLCRIFFFFDNW